jgi:hypothetical protein
MHKLLLMVAISLLAVVPSLSAGAHGCIKGAVVGGLVGHVAGHHAVAGAAVGCVVGHHRATMKQKEASQAQAGAPKSAGGAPPNRESGASAGPQ